MGFAYFVVVSSVGLLKELVGRPPVVRIVGNNVMGILGRRHLRRIMR
jgi:hypothetical protein